MDWTWLGPPLDVRPLFPRDRRALLDLLTTLDVADWRRPTACPGWEVHDVVAHLLHDHFRRLSGGRDGHPGPPFGPGETLPQFITRSNEDFVRTSRQLSPRLLTDLLATLGPQLDDFWAGLDPAAPAGLDVSWAAPGTPAPNWLDTAREYTEFWVHQQQIRDAVNRPGATEPELLHPVLNTFLRALPYTLRDLPAQDGAAVRVRVPGPAGGTWTAVREGARWALRTPATPDDRPTTQATAEVEVDADVLWRLATRGITPTDARHRATVRGDEQLARAVLTLVAIVREPDPDPNSRIAHRVPTS
ncbi:maleylpyruvate isomerase family mycothiol-dependent enzyme [Streptomyces sp. ME19-01-6]|uniref:maleylpyruvate isomerase family mycothiol-dependent enzyme n=1 Tax=Streptomyces sp. ME19-01-6 TaxID=3028686 RepID=UPI0029BF94F6|nr:maleylpyruvate isomerase family mycothiol-dependent enzyme [Streptomyces sp. ME19-01-6]MDX3229994.1 maleylpyruvate isomerase family mycothiol-dependent enzyme [Streptomyces sp. ME19-01-6]